MAAQSERMANKHRRVDHPPANSGSAYNLGNPDLIPRSHREFLEYKGSQVVQGFRNAKNLNLFHGKMRFAKNPPHEPADDGSFIVQWSRWDPVSNPFDWTTGLDSIVQELSDTSIGQRLATQVKDALRDAGKKLREETRNEGETVEDALRRKKVGDAPLEKKVEAGTCSPEAGIKQLEDALLRQMVVVAIDGAEEYSFLITDVHIHSDDNAVELKAVHVIRTNHSGY